MRQHIEISKNGMVKKEIVLASNLPIFDFSSDETTGIKVDYCTKSELENYIIYNRKIELDKFEQENLIVGFFRDLNYRGYLPLYSLKEIANRRF